MDESIKDSDLSERLTDEGITQFEHGNITGALLKFEAAVSLCHSNMIAIQYRGICECLIALGIGSLSKETNDSLRETILHFSQSHMGRDYIIQVGD